MEEDAVQRYIFNIPMQAIASSLFMGCENDVTILQVEFRTVMSTNKELQFSVEVSLRLTFSSLFVAEVPLYVNFSLIVAVKLT